ncbi:DUF4331 domain-containing protein [Rhodococcus sp. X156]|uniref:DUF4331 domain-containing protein n=1 Tax=Rhodococcus sp. X156 TaxID=2499145 RepID=UPI000FD92836|nr:DUF4331 domain-containing protein [Rhodococcus sp. X156]
MSSHREAPEISQDPVADNTDVYAFVSPDRPDTVTLLANFIPFQNPDGGPNFFVFGDDVLYEIHVFNTPITAEGQRPDITYQFRFTETYADPGSFMYNLGTVSVDPNGSGATTYANLNRRQTYTVTKVLKDGTSTVVGDDIPSPPCNVGVHSTPSYPQYVPPAIRQLSDGATVFAGQRADAFFVDLGAVFDLDDIRPLQFLHTGPLFPAPGVDSFRGLNVHTIALQLPKTLLAADGSNPTDVMAPSSVIGVYASASRQAMTSVEEDGRRVGMGAWQQVSRLANPLFNELLIGIGQKDLWNASSPTNDAAFLERVLQPELARRLPELYPLVFNNLRAYTKDRNDLVRIFLTGFPEGLVPGFQNYTGPVLADLVRLNMAIPPATALREYGVLVGDLAGFPNGRRVPDDVADVELRAVAGATIPVVDSGYVPDLAVALLGDYAGQENGPLLSSFPYLNIPNSGFATMPRPYAPGS